MYINKVLKHVNLHYITWIVCIICYNAQQTNGDYAKKLLLVAFDGFRWDYMKYVDMPNFRKVISLGSKAPHMESVYPSSTVPGLFSIATGLYPESHGLVGNEMYDPVLNKTINFNLMYQPGKFNYSYDDSVWYQNAEPIWVTAAKHGLRTGSFYWPGIEAKIHGYRPNFWIPFNVSIGFNERVDTAINWFTKENVDLVLLYFPEPDETGHQTGPAPESNDTIKVLKKCDNVMGYLLDQLEDNGLIDKVNMIVLSDHGMTALPIPNKFIDLYKCVNKTDIEYFILNGVVPVKNKTDEVYSSLKNCDSHLKVYKKDDIPERLHYKNNRRVPAIVGMSDEGWRFVANASNQTELRGQHGFDNSFFSMKPFFMAMGPNIKRSYIAPIVSQTDIYSLMCELLRLPPAPNNGSLQTISQILRDPFFDEGNSFLTPSVLIVLVGLGGICTLLILAIVFVYIRHCNGFYFTSNSKDGQGDYVALS